MPLVPAFTAPSIVTPWSPDDVEEPVEAELEGGRMPFLSHLSELRDRVRNAALAFIVATIVCWIFADDIFEWLKHPLFNVWDTKKLGENVWLTSSLYRPPGGKPST